MIEYVEMSIPKKYIYCVMSVYIATLSIIANKKNEIIKKYIFSTI